MKSSYTFFKDDHPWQNPPGLPVTLRVDDQDRGAWLDSKDRVMIPQQILYLLPYLASFAVSLGIGLYALGRRHVAGATALSILALSESGYIFGYIFELLSPDLAGKIFWDNFQFFGSLVFPAGLILFALEYSRRESNHRLRTYALFAVAPVAVTALAYTDEFHHLVRTDSRLLPAPPFGELSYSYTPVVMVTIVYVYAVILAGLFILIRALFRLHPIYRAQTLTVLAGMLFPVAGSVLSVIGISLRGHRDTAPFSFAISNVFVAWGLFRLHLLDIVPIAHDRVFENMPDAVFVIDVQHRIVDMNPAGEALIEGVNETVIGKRASEILTGWTAIIDSLQTSSSDHDEIEINIAGEKRYIDVNLSPLITKRGGILGYLIVARDVTHRKQVENEEHQQRIFAEALIEITKALNSTLDLDDLLECIFDNIEDVIPFKRAEIGTIRDSQVYLMGTRNIGEERPGTPSGPLGTTDSNPVVKILHETRKPVLVSDTATLEADPVLGKSRLAQLEWVGSYLGMPILSGERFVGFIHLGHESHGFYCEEHLPRVQAFAEQVAIAIENARLYRLAKTAAVAEERQRLARDIHDSVSQTLFASKSIAEILMEDLSGSSGEQADYARQIVRLNKAATSELRTLMLEMRSNALEQTDLGTLLRLLSDSFTGNTEVPVEIDVPDKLFLPNETQVIFYRIAQEALNNITRYANATRVMVGFRREDGMNVLRIADNGQGFEPANVSSERLGIKLMHEHAETIGAKLEINSAVGAGTEVILRSPI